MEIAAVQADFDDVLTKVLLSIPRGFVFDEVYIIEHLSAEYFDKYMNFCGLYAYSTRTAPLKDEPIVLEIQSASEIDLKELGAEPLAKNRP